jgi:putative hydrolase
MGLRRLEAIAASLAARLSQRPHPRIRPSVRALLSVDAEYRRRGTSKQLPHIAPRRFNPENRAWLPILHTSREGWNFTALFSNTLRAHKLGRTHDWVVIHADRDGEHDQYTVVTEKTASGPRRTVRGREVEVEEISLQERATSSGGRGDAPTARH